MTKLYRFFAGLLCFLLLALAALFILQAWLLDALPLWMLGGFSALFLALAIILSVLLLRYSESWKSKTLFLCLALVLGGFFGMLDFYVYKTHDMLNIVTAKVEEKKSTVSLHVLNTSSIESAENLNHKKVAYLERVDSYGTGQMRKWLKEQNISVEEVPVKSLAELAAALYDKKVDAIWLNDSNCSNLYEMEGYEQFLSETRVPGSVTYTLKAGNDSDAVESVIQQPFTILISGIDVYGDLNQQSRSDVNMLVSVNPQTKTVLLTGIPRDYYVPIACEPEYGCFNGEPDKLTHAGIHGIETSQETIEKLLGIDINYTFRVNFSSVENIVDSLGGIDVFVEPGLAVERFYADHTLEGVHEGWNHLDGKRALAFARERYAYKDGDAQRIRNQRIVLRAIFDKVISSQILVSYASFMDALSDSFQTNMSKNEMTSLIQYQLDERPLWQFVEYSLKSTDGMEYSAELGDYASVQLPIEASVKQAGENIRNVLAGKPVIIPDDEPEEEQAGEETALPEEEAPAEGESLPESEAPLEAVPEETGEEEEG